jgi:hypothetical protein
MIVQLSIKPKEETGRPLPSSEIARDVFGHNDYSWSDKMINIPIEIDEKYHF